jgi:hypothetical protein
MNKTQVSDSSPTGCQYHNRKISLRFCAGRGVGQSAGSSVGTSARMSAGSSVGSRNVVHFHPVTSKNVNQILGSVKT